MLFLFTGTPVLAQVEPLTYVKDTTVKVCQLTGDWDFGWKMRTRTLTGEKHGIFFTDLGSSFEHEDKVGFLFGDTLWTGAERDRDFIAFSKGWDPYAMELEFHGTPAIPIEVPGIRHGQLEVPSGGISIDGDIYIVFTTQSDGLHAPREKQMRKSVVALSDDDGKTWENLYTLAEADGDDFSGVHFINVSMALAPRMSGLPDELASKEVLFIWGAGMYRNSDMFLAVCNPARFKHPGSLFYYAGDGSWSRNQFDAVPVFEAGCLGEFSAGWIEAAGKWVVLYSADMGEKRGCFMRSASIPWGAYSEPEHLFEPWRDRGYSEFMHISSAYGLRDDVMDPGRDFQWGGEYAPYLISGFTQAKKDRLKIFFTLSTWNPYQVVLMESTLSTKSGVKDGTPVYREQGLKWRSLANTLEKNGCDFVMGEKETTAALAEVPASGELTRLEFEIWGGDAEAVLIESNGSIPDRVNDVSTFYKQLKSGEFGRIVRVASGLRDYGTRRKVIWQLAAYDRDKLVVVLVDPWTMAWGGGSISPVIARNEGIDTMKGMRRNGRSDKNWNTSGDAEEFIFEERHGRRYVGTIGKHAAQSGIFSRSIKVPAEKTSLCFFAYGTGGSVRLFSDNEMVKEHLARPVLLPGDKVEWDVSGFTGQTLRFEVVDPAHPSQHVFLSVSEPEFLKLRIPGDRMLSATRPEKARRIAVGTSDWLATDRAMFFKSYRDGDISWISTVGDRGDKNTGYLWRNLPPLHNVRQIEFQVTGSGGAVYLLEGEIPRISLDMKPGRLARRIEAGEFGKVMGRACGNADDEKVDVVWETKGKLERGARIIIVDHARSPGGRLSVSDMKAR